MNDKERKLICWRLFNNWKKYSGIESIEVKLKLDKEFCEKFTVDLLKRPDYLVAMIEDAIFNQKEQDLELLLSLAEHFEMTKYIDETISPLLIQPWHHFHDTIARILEFDKNEKTTNYLFLGATYTCENLEYESDYYGFNKKCLYGLFKIGTDEAIQYIKEVSNCNNKIIASYAVQLINKYNL